MRPWGYEEFRLADLGYRDTFVREGWLAGNSMGELMDTYLDRIVGDRVYDFYGRQFPVCIRFIKLEGRMPLQVHPDDETASQRYDLLGKEKLWYILKTGKDAMLGLGFRKDCDAGTLFQSCMDNSAADLLNLITPRPGQSFRIAAGTPHYASGELEILEISESSPLDFCLCGWGEEVSEEQFDPSLEFSDALDFIYYGAYEADLGKDDVLSASPLLTVKRVELPTALRLEGNGETDSFVIYSCVSGRAEVQAEIQGESTRASIGPGESVLVPAECSSFRIVPTDRDSVLLETTNTRVEVDNYIDPDVAAQLPENE